MSTETQEAVDGDLGAELGFMLRCGHNDAGNSRRFTKTYLGYLINVTGPGWLRWTGSVWDPVSHDDLIREAKFVAKRIWKEVEGTEDEDKRKRIAQWAHTSGNRARLEAMVKLAAAGEYRDADVRIGGVGQLDRDRNVINAPNGVVDLASGDVLDHEDAKEQYCTRITRVGYDAEADTSGWEAWLKIFWPDPDVRHALKRLAGASITGHAVKLFPVLIGPGGDNGKTTLVEAISSTLGSYGGTALEATFTNATANDAQYDLAELRGKRFVVFSETREGHGLASERIKRVTGGDKVSARAPYGKPFSYKPEFTLWLATNHPPRIASRDDAMWKRVRAIPCLETIRRDKQIDDYAEVLVREHGAGIMRWLVEGAQEFYESNRRPPRPSTAMREYADSWRRKDDVVQRWLVDETEPAPKGSVRFPDLWASFEAWCEQHGEVEALRGFTSQRFHDEMDSHYERSASRSKGVYRRLGLRLRGTSG